MKTNILFLTTMILLSFVSLNNNEFSEKISESESESGYSEYLIQKFMNATDEDTSILDSLFNKKRKSCL